MPLPYLRKHPEVSPADQAPSPPELRADEWLFPQVSQPNKHVDRDVMAQKPKLHPLKTYLTAFPWS